MSTTQSQNRFDDYSPQHPLPPVSIGDKISLFYNEGNHANTLYHVRGIVDGRLVLARWLTSKQRWEYEVKDGVWWTVYKHNCRIIKSKSADEGELK